MPTPRIRAIASYLSLFVAICACVATWMVSDRVVRETEKNRLEANEARQEREQALLDRELSRQQRELFYGLLIRSNIALAAVDDNGNVTRWNVAAEKKFGWVPEDVIGKPVTMIMGQPVPEKHLKAFREHTVADWVKKRIAIDCWVKTKTGELKRVMVYTYDTDERPGRYLAVMHTPTDVIKRPKPTVMPKSDKKTQLELTPVHVVEAVYNSI